MTTIAKATKQIIQAYKVVRKVQALTQAKLDALLETNALHKLFEQDIQHPYYALADAGKNTLTAFESVISGVQEWTIGNGTIAEELDKVKARQIEKEEEEDADLDALRLIGTVVMTEAEAADKMISAYYSACAVWIKVKESVINAELSDIYGRKNVSRHKENPEIKITKEANSAIREILKTAKQIRDCGNGTTTIRRELEKKQVMRGLSGQGKEAVIELFLKP